MIKRLLGLYTLLSLVGCTEVAIEETIPTTSEEYCAIIEDGTSRTYVDEQIRMRWTAEDHITLFEKNTYNRTFMFTGKTGANAGGFRKVSTDDDYWFGYDVDANYAVYPHSNDNTLDETKLFLTVDMPAEQTYAENSFGLGANTMVAVSDNNQLLFKNVGSCLRVRLYGNNTSVSSITLTNKGNEAIAGEAKVTPVMNGEPTCVMTGSGKSIRLTCQTPVSISSDANNPTDFWIVVPPVTLASGFTVTVENSDGKTQTYDVNKSFTFERNKYNNMVRELEIEDIPTIHVAQAGTLSSLIDDDEKYTISELKISGDLNGTDIRLIREMLGCDYTGESTNGKLSSLDLSEATIVEGGKSYYEVYNKTSSNKIGDNMFWGCTNLQNIILPDNITSIGDNAFYSCTSLTTVEIGDGVTSIGQCAFYSCGALTTIKIPDSVTSIDYNAFYRCTSLTTVEIGDGVTSIGQAAFYFCHALTTIKIPDSVTSINNSAFSYCSALITVEIGDGVTSIDNYAFSYCSINVCYCYATNPPSINSYSFKNGVEEGATLYVPTKCVDVYKSSSWGDYFENIVEMN